MKENVLLDKSLNFAVRIVKLYKLLRFERQEYVMSKQLLRSGTSIGANVSEAQAAQSNADFISKLHISLKECNESIYWIKLLSMTEYITTQEADSIHSDAKELYALLISIIKTAKNNSQQPRQAL